jgi:hypothetical protein
MALPTAADLNTLNYVFQGQPFCNTGASTMNADSLNYVFQGQPFYFVSDAGAGAGNIKTIGGIPVANVKTWGGISWASIKKIFGITK